MEYFYYVFVAAENGKYYAWAVKVPGSNNLLPHIEREKNLVIVHQFKTMKKAKETAEFWNECYKRNGTFLFDETF